MEEFRRKIILTAGLISFMIAFGTAGYMIIEGWNFLDALFMTATTLTTVGYREVHELTRAGQIFTIVLIMGGVGTVFYALSTGAKLILEGELRDIFGRQRMERKIQGLNEHYIVCGYGRMGRIICRELKEKRLPFIVVEKNVEKISQTEDLIIFEGDATQDEVLKSMGIERARGLISVLPTDAENLYVVLSARVLNPNLLIVARAGEEGSEQKLIRAGADRVVSPYHIGGLRIAHTVLKPAVVDFIEFATRSGNIELQMEEITIKENSKLAGCTLDECGFGRELGVIILAVKEASGDMKFNPTFRTRVKAGDTVIAIGEIPKLKVLEDQAAGRKF